MADQKLFLRRLIDASIREKDNCEVFTIRFADGGFYDGHHLPDISSSLHKEHLFHEGASDQAYERYKTDHEMKDLTDFNAGGIEELYLVLEDGFRQRKIIFKAIYDSDKED